MKPLAFHSREIVRLPLRPGANRATAKGKINAGKAGYAEGREAQSCGKDKLVVIVRGDLLSADQDGQKHGGGGYAAHLTD